MLVRHADANTIYRCNPRHSQNNDAGPEGDGRLVLQKAVLNTVLETVATVPISLSLHERANKGLEYGDGWFNFRHPAHHQRTAVPGTDLRKQLEADERDCGRAVHSRDGDRSLCCHCHDVAPDSGIVVGFEPVIHKMPSYHDFATHENKQRNFTGNTQKFVLDRDLLTGLALPVPLSWTTIPFRESTKNLVADEPGLYAFLVQSEQPSLPPHGYVTYIGQTGKDQKGPRTLRRRFTEYLREQKRPKRWHIWFMLNKWKPCISFCFAPVDPAIASLPAIEAKLNDAMFPPYSHQDFSAEIRIAKRLWEKQ